MQRSARLLVALAAVVLAVALGAELIDLVRPPVPPASRPIAPLPSPAAQPPPHVPGSPDAPPHAPPGDGHADGSPAGGLPPEAQFGDFDDLEECVDEATDKFGCFQRVPAATFPMGAQAARPDAPGYDPLAEPDQGPVHEVTIDAFFLQRHEVTVTQFQLCVARGKCRAEDVASGGGYLNFGRPERIEHPVNGVTWRGARDYCAMIGGRLPTEAEWERAARGTGAGPTPWGTTPPGCSHANLGAEGDRRCSTDATRHIYWIPQFTPLKLVYAEHMVGNVWEWVADWYDPGYYARSPAKNPKGPEAGELRVLRGAAFTTTEPAEQRLTFRSSLAPELKLDDVGFRCAVDRLR